MSKLILRILLCLIIAAAFANLDKVMSLRFGPFGIRNGKMAAKEQSNDTEEQEYKCIGFPYSAYDAQSVEDNQDE